MTTENVLPRKKSKPVPARQADAPGEGAVMIAPHSPADRRKQLLQAGYQPIPVRGKIPPFTAWQQKTETNPDEIDIWSKVFPDALSTSLLTRRTPALDLDILHQEAVEACEALARERFEEKGHFLTRIGRPPKRAALFRTNQPFKKILVNLIAPNGDTNQKIEMLADGQQLVAFGIHPDTGRAYHWHGGEPGKIPYSDLPCLHEAEAKQLVEDCAGLLCRDFGYQRAKGRPKKEKADTGNDGGIATADWGCLVENIRAGRSLHDSLRDLAAKLVTSGMGAGAAVNFLRGLMDETPEAERDKRWKDRRAEIPRLVESARGPQEEARTFTPCTLNQTLEVFGKWLLLPDLTPIYAVLGTVAANLLPGDPVWLGLIGPPSSAKTEILNSTLLLPHIVQAATLTPAGCLSGTPKKQHDKGAKGGLLRQIGEFGIIVLKDFGSVLSMRPDAKAETLGALREIYDGSWTRVLGTDGGKTLTWSGKVGLLFGATGVIDAHYSVIGAMGDRFLLTRLAPIQAGQFARALHHQGAATKRMRTELAEAVANLFAGKRSEARKINDVEIKRIDDVISLVVRLRGAVERDRNSREVEAVYGAEGTARIGLALERLLAGLDTLGVDRALALDVIEAVAMDSVPPLRRKAYEHLCAAKSKSGKLETRETPAIARALDLPTTTVRRALEELAAYQLVTRKTRGPGNADLWKANEVSR
jgi:Bifunctional DNA primase/polymerase, N-terminal